MMSKDKGAACGSIAADQMAKQAAKRTVSYNTPDGLKDAYQKFYRRRIWAHGPYRPYEKGYEQYGKFRGKSIKMTDRLSKA